MLQQFLAGDLDDVGDFAKEKDVVACVLDDTSGQVRSSGKFAGEQPATGAPVPEDDKKDEDDKAAVE